MFDAHINVEWCNTARAIKYLFKYISKGPDRATMVIGEDQPDEIKTYLDCRYVSACEAVWRIFEFEIHERNPSVMRLPVHLEGEHAVVLKDTDDLNAVINSEKNNDTMLTAWMEVNATSAEARELTYAEFPTKFRWDNGWIKRQRGTSIGRISYVHPTAGQRYYLRLLLNIVKGPTSFEDIRTVNGRVYPTYKDACYVLGLLNDDKEWHEAIQEASHWAMPYQLRELFVTMLLFCEVTDVASLWEHNYEQLSEDILRKKRKLFQHPGLLLTEEQIRTYTLLEIDEILIKFGKSLSEIDGMPKPSFTDIEGLENKLLREEMSYDKRQLKKEWEDKIAKLNTDQSTIYKKVIGAVENDTGEVFFVYGHGGTGKTFLYSTISAKLRSQGNIVLNVASSG